MAKLMAPTQEQFTATVKAGGVLVVDGDGATLDHEDDDQGRERLEHRDDDADIQAERRRMPGQPVTQQQFDLSSRSRRRSPAAPAPTARRRSPARRRDDGRLDGESAAARKRRDAAAGFLDQQQSRHRVPRRELEFDVAVEPAVGDVRELQRRRAEIAKRGIRVHQRAAQLEVARLRRAIRVADRDHRARERRRGRRSRCAPRRRVLRTTRPRRAAHERARRARDRRRRPACARPPRRTRSTRSSTQCRAGSCACRRSDRRSTGARRCR